MNTTHIGSFRAWGIAVFLCTCAALTTQAISYTLGGPLPTLRTATLDSATDGFTGSGNASVTDVNAGFAALSPWTERGQETAAAVSAVFDVALTSGSWGAAAAAGTWTITSTTFWDLYDNAAISLHVGGGQGDPDHFVWLLETDKSSGTWSYDGTGVGTGGGLSNLKLYSSGGTSVPDGGMTMVLLGMAFMSLASLNLKKRAVEPARKK